MAFGIYQEGSTPAHRLDPRTKLVAVLLYLIAAFVASGWVALALVAVTAIAVLAASGVGPAGAWRSLRPFLWLMLFVLVFDMLFVNDGMLLAGFGIITISTGGISFALQSVLRFACVLLATSTLMLTTSPTAITDGSMLLLAPLRRLGANLDDAALAISMTFRFIPVISEEFAQVKAAQRARLADFDHGSVLARLRAYLPVLVPLFVRSLRRSEALALAIGNREYGAHPGTARSCLRQYRLTGADGVVLLGFALLLAAVIALGILL